MREKDEENEEKQKKTMFHVRTDWMNKTTMMREKTDSLQEKLIDEKKKKIEGEGERGVKLLI